MSQDPRWSAETEELVREHAGVYQVDAEGILTALADAGLLAARRECGNTIDAPFLGLDPLTCDQPAGHATPHSQAMPGHTLPATWDLPPEAPPAQWVDDTRPAAMLRTVEFDTTDEPAAPRVWAMPAIPDDVRRITAVGGDIIAEREAEDPRYWEVRSAVTGRVLAPYLLTSQLITAYGPLTEIMDGSGMGAGRE